MKKYFILFIVLVSTITFFYNEEMSQIVQASNLDLVMVENIQVFCEDSPSIDTPLCAEHHSNGSTATTQSATVCLPMTTLWEQGKQPVVGMMHPCSGPTGNYDVKTKVGRCVKE